MGYTTDFIGHININPPLNAGEQAYLTAFSTSRRYDRAGGSYEVPGNPSAEAIDAVTEVEILNSLAPGAPSLWCDWVPCWDGCCIAHSGIEKSYRADAWLTYLIDHFLAPGAQAAEAGLDRLRAFTFDHRLDGIIAANRRDTRELYLIRVENNVVRTEALARSLAPAYEMGPLAYEVGLDDDRKRRRRRPRR